MVNARSRLELPGVSWRSKRTAANVGRDGKRGLRGSPGHASHRPRSPNNPAGMNKARSPDRIRLRGLPAPARTAAGGDAYEGPGIERPALGGLRTDGIRKGGHLRQPRERDQFRPHIAARLRASSFMKSSSAARRRSISDAGTPFQIA